MAQEMPDWSELQHDLLVLIRRRINLIEDFLNFGIVCKSWHSVPTKNNFNSDLPRIPWLMLAEEEEDKDCRKFFSLYNGMILNKRIPKATGKRCMESMGWLITVGKDEGEISLLHPFSGVQIQLPHQNTTEDYDEHETGFPFTFIGKAVLSASPSHTSDFVLMVVEGNLRFLSFWRPADSRWTRISWVAADHSPFVDVVYFNGHFYAVNYRCQVVVCDVAGPEPTKKSHIVAQLPFDPLEVIGNLYILESLGSLFVVVRDDVYIKPVKDDCDTRMRFPLTYVPWEGASVLQDGEKLIYGTTAFRVFQVDIAVDGKVKVTQTKELGDRAFFLGANSSLSIQASQFPGIKPNHIYFTDDFFESYLIFAEGGGLDMGVCNLADGSIQLHYEAVSLSPVCPPTWVTPTLY
ncbi:F-box protein At2g26160-like [Lycium barbarum]|uniref:F-box protein At2g26160-like n=1 Tax=Lycium barbarum TaxID=112863 RepID=UPI00293E2243|nr:F-box protein At2g26160-like [Lycium barbarum]